MKKYHFEASTQWSDQTISHVQVHLGYIYIYIYIYTYMYTWHRQKTTQQQEVAAFDSPVGVLGIDCPFSWVC